MPNNKCALCLFFRPPRAYELLPKFCCRVTWMTKKAILRSFFLPGYCCRGRTEGESGPARGLGRDSGHAVGAAAQIPPGAQSYFMAKHVGISLFLAFPVSPDRIVVMDEFRWTGWPNIEHFASVCFFRPDDQFPIEPKSVFHFSSAISLYLFVRLLHFSCSPVREEKLPFLGRKFCLHLQTLNTISAEKNSTIVFPLPIDILSHLMKKSKAE